MDLPSHGLQFFKPDPAVVMPFPNGTAFVGWRDPARSLDSMRQFSDHDADRYNAFFEYLDECAGILNANMFEPPPVIADLLARIRDPRSEDMFATVFLRSIQDLLDEWFESDEVKAMIGSLAIVSSLVGPRTPGTLLRPLLRPLSLHSSAASDPDDPRRQTMRGSTGIPLGGMGAVPRAMARSFKAVGGEIRTGCPVERIVTRDGRATGVILEGGEEISAWIVLSNLNPKTTLLDLLDDGVLEPAIADRVRRIPMKGSAFKVGLALSDLPRFAFAKDDAEARLVAGCQFRIAPTLSYMERAYDDAKYGRPSTGPMLWGTTPSVADPDLAPPGCHVMSVNVFHAPYQLSEGTWDDERERFGNHCIDALTEYIPNLKGIITNARFWSPIDLEREYGLVGANITHGEVLPHSMFSLRPFPGWSHYATPVNGLYFCGAGAWPGGFVSGLPGHNASHQVLADVSAGRLSPHAIAEPRPKASAPATGHADQAEVPVPFGEEEGV
jgi:phytoene dehydrogenase-like protein